MAFTVQYETECTSCGQTVRKGTQGYYIGSGDIVHYPDCPSPVEVCNKCFMEKSITGKCGCD